MAKVSNGYIQNRVKAIENAYADATHGRWYVHSDRITIMAHRDDHIRVPVANMLIAGDDQRFIVLVHEEIPWLMAMLKQREQRIFELVAENENLKRQLKAKA